MKVDYTYHYRKWNNDSPTNRALAIRYYRRILNGFLPGDPKARFLDVGCGAGLLMLALRELGYTDVQGIDIDPGQVESCRNKGLNALCADNTPGFLSSKANHYDALLAFDVLEHIAPGEQLEFVAAMCGALKPRGKLICTVPNANSTLSGRYRYIDFTHCTSFTEHSLDFLLYNGGLREIQVMAVEYFVRPRFWWVPLPQNAYWWLFRLVRTWRRLELMGELGTRQGRSVPISLNLMAIATRP